MDKDRADLLDLSITIAELKYGKAETYEELYFILDALFSKLRFTLDEIVEYYSLSIETEDAYLTLINSGNELRI